MKKPRDLVGRGLRQEQREGCRGLRRGGRGGQHGRISGERGGERPGEALSFLFPDFTSRLLPSPSSWRDVTFDELGGFPRPVQQIERCEVVAAAGVIAAALAAAVP
jgi:hypothetical protein